MWFGPGFVLARSGGYRLRIFCLQPAAQRRPRHLQFSRNGPLRLALPKQLSSLGKNFRVWPTDNPAARDRSGRAGAPPARGGPRCADPAVSGPDAGACSTRAFVGPPAASLGWSGVVGKTGRGSAASTVLVRVGSETMSRISASVGYNTASGGNAPETATKAAPLPGCSQLLARQCSACASGWVQRVLAA